MPSRYPKYTGKQGLIHRSDTDSSLSADAQMKNNTRYIYFTKVALGGKCLIQSCKDLHLGRVICYKSLRQELANHPLEQKLFLREARVTAMLQHPNTAPVYEVGFDAKGHYYFTMKLVAGVTLREVLDGLIRGDADFVSSWDLERLIDVIIQVGQVLSYAHVHGVVHCDVKPENIVAGSFGEVLLLDWGLALYGTAIRMKKLLKHQWMTPAFCTRELRTKALRYICRRNRSPAAILIIEPTSIVWERSCLKC